MNSYTLIYGPAAGPWLALAVVCEENLAAIYDSPEGRRDRLVIKHREKIATIINWTYVHGVFDNRMNIDNNAEVQRDYQKGNGIVVPKLNLSN